MLQAKLLTREKTPFLISPKGEKLLSSCPLGGRMGRGLISRKSKE